MKNNYKKITACRVCGNQHLELVLDLGMQYLTGIFPASKDLNIPQGPLQLALCKQCGLVQLLHSFEPSLMYGDNYGYRSGLNQSMVRHLTRKIHYLEKLCNLKDGSVVVDIGSNDCTSLKAYQTLNLIKIGIDPTGRKFEKYYPENVLLIPDFFSSQAFESVSKNKASIVTSLAMFYDLESPVQFAQEIESILCDDGVWHFEQSYLPLMLKANSYDTICHEHLEYYSLSTIKYILNKAKLKLIDVQVNDINGGSFAVSAAKENNSSLEVNHVVIDWYLNQELVNNINQRSTYDQFANRVKQEKNKLIDLIRRLNAADRTIFVYGASTKGNVTLQYCELTSADIRAAVEVNSEKFGCFTPGSNIPIISESDAKSMKIDYYLVLPWHFKNEILNRERNFINDGGRFIFPFPELEII